MTLPCMTSLAPLNIVIIESSLPARRLGKKVPASMSGANELFIRATKYARECPAVDETLYLTKDYGLVSGGTYVSTSVQPSCTLPLNVRLEMCRVAVGSLSERFFAESISIEFFGSIETGEIIRCMIRSSLMPWDWSISTPGAGRPLSEVLPEYASAR